MPGRAAGEAVHACAVKNSELPVEQRVYNTLYEQLSDLGPQVPDVIKNPPKE